jgi:hypothetical protein
MQKFKNILFVIISTLVLANCGGGGGGGSEPAPVPVPTPAPAMDFSYEAPETLNDYQPFEITVTPSNLQTGETVEVSVEDVDNQILFLNISEYTITARAPFTYTSVDLDFDIKLTSSNSRTATKSVTIPVSFRNVAAERFNTSDDLLAFNPNAETEAKLQNDNYAVWDIMPMLRGERKKLPAGTYCYPTPDICSYQPGEWPPGFIPADIVEGDFDGDGDQDVIYSADLGDRRFKALGYPEGVTAEEADKSYWSSVHLLFNDGTGRLIEDFSKYEDGEPPRIPFPYHIVVEDFNNDGIDDAFVGSFGAPRMNEDNTNYNVAWPHLYLKSGDGIHKNIWMLQNEAELQENPNTSNEFAHDASSGDVDGDGDIDVFMNAVLYFNDGEGNFEIVGLNVKEEYYPCCGIQKEKIDKTHAHASTMGDYNADGIDDLVILWSGIPEAYREPGDVFGPRTHNNILLGPVYKDDPIMLDNEKWKTLPDAYYGPENGFYNHADSGDIDGDGDEDIVIGSTRGAPYYAGRHVQILISNGDGTFEDETSTRFADQPRAGLDESLQGTGIGEGVIALRDVDGDGDLDIVDTQAIYGGEDFAIYPRVTLAFNNGEGVFEEVPLDYFPLRMMWDDFDRYNNSGVDVGPPLIHRSGLVDLDGEGHLDLVSSLQGTLFRVTEDDPEAKQESIVTTQTFISKRKVNQE